MLKQAVYNKCLTVIEERIDELRRLLNDLSSGGEESKSSAGDKHETARAMMHLEQEKISRQLEEASSQKEQLLRVKSSTVKRITNGSFVKTDKGYFFILISLGKIYIESQAVYVLSPDSPLGKAFMGSSISDNVMVNGVTYTVEEIQ